jgi:hypothetical protein
VSLSSYNAYVTRLLVTFCNLTRLLAKIITIFWSPSYHHLVYLVFRLDIVFPCLVNISSNFSGTNQWIKHYLCIRKSSTLHFAIFNVLSWGLIIRWGIRVVLTFLVCTRIDSSAQLQVIVKKKTIIRLTANLEKKPQRPAHMGTSALSAPGCIFPSSSATVSKGRTFS